MGFSIMFHYIYIYIVIIYFIYYIYYIIYIYCDRCPHLRQTIRMVLNRLILALSLSLDSNYNLINFSNYFL